MKDVYPIHSLYVNESDDVLYNYSYNCTDKLPNNCTHTVDEHTEIIGTISIIIVVSLLSIIGNIVMVCAVLRLPYLRTVTNLFTINLAISDLGIATLSMPMWIISMTIGRHTKDSPIPIPVCKATAFATVLLLLVSIATLSGISLDRYFSICHPMRYPQEITPNRVYCVLAYIWIQSLLLSITPLLGWGDYTFQPQTISICNPQWINNIGFSSFLLIIGMIIPCSVMLFSYIRIIKEAMRQAKRIDHIQLKLIEPLEVNPDYPSTNQNGAPDIPRRPNLMKRIKKISLIHKSYKTFDRNLKTFDRNLKTFKTVFIIVGEYTY